MNNQNNLPINLYFKIEKENIEKENIFIDINDTYIYIFNNKDEISKYLDKVSNSIMIIKSIRIIDRKYYQMIDILDMEEFNSIQIMNKISRKIKLISHLSNDDYLLFSSLIKKDEKIDEYPNFD